MLNLESIWGWGKTGREWATIRRTSTGKSSEIHWKPQECVVSRKIQSKSCLWSYQPVTNRVAPRYCEDIHLQNLLSTCYLCRKVENLSRWVLQRSVTKPKSVLTWQENPSRRKTNWKSTFTYKFIYYFWNLGKFLIFFAKKLNVKCATKSSSIKVFFTSLLLFKKHALRSHLLTRLTWLQWQHLI